MRYFRRLCGWLAVLIAVTTVLLPMEPMTTVAAEASSPSVELYADTSELLGDVDGNGILNTMDALLLYSHVSGVIFLPIAQQLRADITADGVIDSHDAILLFREAAGMGSVTTTTTATPSTTATTRATALVGIDVSYAQGVVSWSEVKETEVSFAILRCGYGNDEPGQQDEYWEQNTAACEELDIPYGAYFFCYARNAEEAAREAQHALRLLEGKRLTYPVFLDMEYSTWQGDLTPAQYAEVATVFCETVGAAGYKVGVYSNADWWNNRLTDPCFDRWYRWVAQYNDACDYTGYYHMWQYSDSGQVDGIDGPVDMNYCYADFSMIL